MASENKDKTSKSDHLAKVYIKEAEELLNHYETAQRIEMAEHLMQLFMELDEFYKTKNQDLKDNFYKREHDLLLRYGREFEPYTKKSFHKLFDFSILLSETDYYTVEEFNALKEQEYELSQLDVSRWISKVLRYLESTRYHAYLARTPQFELNGTEEEHDKEMTEARRLLAIHFILKAGFNIEPKISHSATALAHLAHLLLGKRFTSAQDSTIYKKYLKMPEFNSGSVLVKDLNYIRHYFEELDMKNVLELIDLQIASIKNKDK